MARYNREDYRTVLPQLEKTLDALSEDFWKIFKKDKRGQIKGKLEMLIPKITPTSGELQQAVAVKCGNVVQLFLMVRNTVSAAAGGNVFAGMLDTEELRPYMYVMGSGYYTQFSMIGSITSDGSITIRNANAAAFPAPSGTNYVAMTFTYLIA